MSEVVIVLCILIAIAAVGIMASGGKSDRERYT